MKPVLSKYWAYQSFGWGLFVFINVCFALIFDRFNADLISRLMIFVGLGVSISHLMRYAIIQRNLLMKPVQQQLIGFLLITLIFSLIFGFLEIFLKHIFGLRSRQEANFGEARNIITSTFCSFVYLFIWNCIYLIYHTSQRPRVSM